MKRKRVILVGGALVGLALLTGRLYATGFFDREVWKREQPLVNPVRVDGVKDGQILFADGRVLRPTGVARRSAVSAEEYDEALRVITLQGVVVARDLGDGRVLLIAEPKFYNWCGTRGYNGKPWARWAGSYLRCPVSELLIVSGYGVPDVEEAGLTALERWRLEGAEHVQPTHESPRQLFEECMEYDGSVWWFGDYDAMIEFAWKPPPSP